MSDGKVTKEDRIYFASVDLERACDIACEAAWDGDQYKLAAVAENKHVQVNMFRAGMHPPRDAFFIPGRILRNWHPLHFAAEKGHVLVITDLLEMYHASPDVIGRSYDYGVITPLWLAVEAERTAAVKCLVNEYKANVNHQTYMRRVSGCPYIHLLQLVLNMDYRPALLVFLRSGRLDFRAAVWQVRSYKAARMMMRCVPSAEVLQAYGPAPREVHEVVDRFRERQKVVSLLVADPNSTASASNAQILPVQRSFFLHPLFDRNVVGMIADCMADHL